MRIPPLNDIPLVLRPTAASAAELVATSPGRRDFLRRFASAGLALGLPPLVASCGGNDDRPIEATAERAPREAQTIFFNLAHENHVGKDYVYEAGGATYALVPVAAKPEVLATARSTNGFLRAVADDQITHHVEAVMVPTGSVMVGFVTTYLDRSAGTWTMSGVYIQSSTASIVAAHALITARHAARGTTPGLAGQRDHYGLPMANTANDLVEQSVLLDPPTHAAALISVHPDLMALDPVASATVVQGHVQQQTTSIRQLTKRIKELGPAAPNPNGWATLTPVIDPTTGKPYRVTQGVDAGRLQYATHWHPDVAALAGGGMSLSIPGVKDDETLGSDITGGTTPAAGRSKLWRRRDGEANVVHTPGATLATGSGPTMTLKSQTSQTGLTVKTTSVPGPGAPTVTITVENWYLRYLGVYIQFLDGKSNPIALKDIPEYGSNKIYTPARIDGGTSSMDSDTEMYAATIGPIATIMGIPIESEALTGSATFTVTLPAAATAIRVMSGGLGSGSNNHPHTLALGAALTSIFNFGFTLLFAAAGVGEAEDAFQKFIQDILPSIVPAISTLLVDLISGNNWTTGTFWQDQGENFAFTLLSLGGTSALKQVVTFAVALVTLGTTEKVLPIVGMIMEAVSAAEGVADILQTTIETAESPWTYISDLVYSYDLSVSLKPNAGSPPAAADTCRVTALFDDGTPHVQIVPIDKVGLPVVFAKVPLGGVVNVSASFSQSATVANAADILLGKGTTGPISNAGSALTVDYDQIEFPIGGTTTYVHKQKTMLADDDQHVWVASSQPSVTGLNSCGEAGTICNLHDITVRQSTATNPGYVGYAFQSQNADGSRAPSCNGGGQAQLDQVANLNVGTNPQTGYALSGCGLPNAGVQVAYSLLGQGRSNFYLDTTVSGAPLLRQVTLDGTPTIDSPDSGLAWGVLNMPSDLMLLHPAGHVVSINSDLHKIETHKLPPTALGDAEARVQLIAEIKSGQGKRPGLIDTPVSAAVGADGTLLILEAGNNRIQALNLGGNPVAHFTRQPQAYFLNLDATRPQDNWVHLDMAVEYTGFIYVLSMNYVSGAYQMNIYHPRQGSTAPIAVSTAMNAGKLTVDFWRNVYTLNYEVIQRSNPGNSAPAPVTEPSVSLWTPCDVGRTCPA